MPFNKILLAAALLANSSASFALPSDREQPINIKADQAEQQQSQGGEKTVYSGNVIMTQGSMLIAGDEVTIFSKDRKVTRIIAVGQPAHFKQQTEQDEKPIDAYGQRIKYNLVDDTVVLLDNASLLQGGSTISGKQIDYNLATEQVKAASTGSSQVQMVLEPTRKKSPQGQ
jgi:lipopolysaccharide export system protein LptA